MPFFCSKKFWFNKLNDKSYTKVGENKNKKLLETGVSGSKVCVKGWVRTKRGSKSVSFVALNDGSTAGPVAIRIFAPLKPNNRVLPR